LDFQIAVIHEIRSRQPDIFRWHVGGDIPDADYFQLMVNIARLIPETKFLAFTKQYKIVNKYLDHAKKLPDNLTIVFSSWLLLEMKNRHNLPVAWLDDGHDKRIPDDAIECAGNCETCGLCWNLPSIGKDVKFKKH
jgi:hypothetical protein